VSKEVSVGLIRSGSELSLRPELGCEEPVESLQGVDRCLHAVSEGLGVALGLGENVLNTGELQHLLGSLTRHNASSPGSRDETHTHGTTLAGDLVGHSVGLADLCTPITTTHGDDIELGINKSTTDSSSNFLRTLHTETNVAVLITNNNEGLEASTLAGTSLLLDGGDLHDLLLQGRAQEVLNNLILLDWEGEKIDLLKGLDLSILYETAELGDGGPFLIITLVATGATATATAAITTIATGSTATAATVAIATRTKTITETATSCCDGEFSNNNNALRALLILRTLDSFHYSC
jgi:hypothetical protein